MPFRETPIRLQCSLAWAGDPQHTEIGGKCCGHGQGRVSTNPCKRALAQKSPDLFGCTSMGPQQQDDSTDFWVISQQLCFRCVLKVLGEMHTHFAKTIFNNHQCFLEIPNSPIISDNSHRPGIMLVVSVFSLRVLGRHEKHR